MKYRCINAFATGDRIYTGGEEVDEGDQILKTHRGHFAEVASRPGVFEAATAAPGEQRDLTPPRKAPAKKAPAKKAAPKAESKTEPARSENKTDDGDKADEKSTSSKAEAEKNDKGDDA
ncbi:hypothetical protein LTT66_18305 [Nocardia gipuzkoensis]|uniref:hypothetical protein n=1 Tax=Nocardia gipuzkoensis TaxID=2749991 RepID=UPI001E43E34B|nr:hypothetical protein [Nocardia gipuzkoensis]UGT65323.1 hypothetical protein LTT66_18305 [Nocardia gipuzkoensis]